MAFLRSRQGLPWQVSAAVLAVAVAAAYFVFRLFDVNYISWYLASGPLIQLLVTAFALGIDLERWPQLISAHPSDYLGACQRVVGLSFLQRAAELRTAGEEEVGRRSDLPRTWPLDGPITALLYIGLGVLSLAWLVVVAPVQYFGNLVAGAPIRLALASQRRYAIASRPVAVTASISAGLLFGISYLV
jgi:hypothetical protein